MSTNAPKIAALSHAFTRTVLGHPTIKGLLREVCSKPERFDQCEREVSPPKWPSWRLAKLLEGNDGPEAGLWSVCADQSLRAQADGRSTTGFLRGIATDAGRVLLVVADKFEEFIKPLRDGSTSAEGHLANGELVRLSPGIWSSSKFWFDILNSNVGEFEAAQNGDSEFAFVPKWNAVSLAGLASTLAPTGLAREKPALLRASMAINALGFAEGFPDGIGTKICHRQINDWLQLKKLQPVSTSTIKRFLSLKRVTVD